MIKHFRIHGDNIVECERLFNLITKSIQTQKAERYFLSPACPSVKITTIDSDILFFKYFPGFNKNTSDRSLFGENDVYSLLYGLIYNIDVTPIYTSLIKKSLKIMDYMTTPSSSNSYTKEDWTSIQNDYSGDILAFSRQNNLFPFAKKIAQKSITGRNKDFANLATKYSTGIASKDLPFGLITSYNKTAFANELRTLYPEMNDEFYRKLSTSNDLIICMFKGFKPHGDDARPDRGILPLIAMLFGESTEILTFIYGETLESTIQKLDQNILSLSSGNGLWSAIVSLSDFIILDAPKIPKNTEDSNIVRLIPNMENKTFSLSLKNRTTNMLISPYPTHYTENDVDTFIHTIFNYIIPNTFEGFCNPPGGDWSGISLINNNDPAIGTEFRWLTLPRVSDSKRPDHITVLFNLFEKPLIICTESKESPRNLEPNIGPALTKYIFDLLSYPPSVERQLNSDIWTISTSTVSVSDFTCASIGCFFAPINFDLSTISSKCNCDVLIGFNIDSSTSRCKVQIKGFSSIGNTLAEYLSNIIQHRNSPINIFDIC